MEAPDGAFINDSGWKSLPYTFKTTGTTRFMRIVARKEPETHLDLATIGVSIKFKLEVGGSSTIYTPAPSEDPVNAYPIYRGEYTDYTADDSTDPTKYTWVRTKGDSGTDGLPGKDGVGIKSTAVSYQASTSGTTAPTGTWLSSPTATAGQYQWTRTVWNYTDGTTEVGYSVGHIGTDGATGKDGIAGKDGVGIRSTTITYATSTSGTSAPTSGWVSTPPTATAGQFVWTRTVWIYTDNTMETGYSVGKIGEKGATGSTGATGAQGVQGPKGPQGAQGPRGPQGPAGNDITSYASGTALPTTVSPANSQFWLLNSSGVAIKFYKSNGSKWIDTPISATSISAATFNGLSFNGVTFSGSTFNTTYDVKPSNKTEEVGTATLSDGGLWTTYTGYNLDAYNNKTQAYTGTMQAAQGMIVSSTTNSNDREAQHALISGGTINLTTINADGIVTTGVLDGDMLSRMNATSNLAWEGTLYPQVGDVATMSTSLDRTYSGWLVEWSYFNNTDARSSYQYTLIPRNYLVYNSGIHMIAPLAMPNVGNFFKELVISNTTITGVAGNNQGSQAPKAIMTRVFVA